MTEKLYKISELTERLGRNRYRLAQICREYDIGKVHDTYGVKVRLLTEEEVKEIEDILREIGRPRRGTPF